MFPSIWNNDDAKAFFREHGYPYESYNDGLLSYLRDIYNTTGSILPDLLKRHLNEYGDTFAMGVLAKSASQLLLINPAATFTAVSVSDNGSGLVRLTSAGVHGLTTSPAVGANIYVSAGTGWTVGFYEVVTVVDTTKIDIQLAYDAGLGTPTIALVNTEVTLVSSTIPALLANSVIRTDVTTSSADTSAATKIIRVRLNTTEFSAITLSTSPNNRRVTIIHNRNSTGSQVAGISLTTASGEGSLGSSPPTGSVDTSVSTTLNITMQINTANIAAGINRYFIELFL